MRELSEAGSRYGAAMGRSNDVTDRDFPVVFEVERLEWVDGDYDRGGAYWGRTFDDPRTRSGSDYIFRFEGESDSGLESMFVRAKTMKAAKEELLVTYPNATFDASADIEAVYGGYRDAALWSSHNDRHDDDPDQPEMLDGTDYELSDEAEHHFRTECAAFIEENADLISAAAEKGMDGENVGHNFWLSRNGHGTGFWDRGLGELGDLLHEAAKKFGGDDLYVGDDDQIHSYTQYRSAPQTEPDTASP
jgi:hypothetical protein